jgi:hypothetical protein
MADGIDPSIALSYRPPNLATMPNLQIQTPLEGLARVVSLRNLMQEGQLKGLQLQQLKLQIEGAQNLAKLYAGMDLDGGAGGGAPALTGPLSGEPTSPQPATVPLSPAAPAGPTAYGMPVTPSGLGVTAGLDQYLTPPPAAPVTTDAGPTPAAITPAAAPGVLPGTPPAGLFAPPPESRTPNLGAFVRADPLGGVAAYEQMMKARKEMYDEADKRLTLRKSESENLANTINGVTDEESLQRNLPQMVRSGALSGAQADYIKRLGYDSPWVQRWLKEKQIQSITYDKTVDLAIKQFAENRAQELHPLTKSKAMTDAEAGEAKSSADSVGLLQGESEFPAWYMKQGPTSQAKYGPIILNPNLTFAQKVQAIQGGAGATARIAEVGPTKEAEYQAGIAPYQSLIQGIMSNQYKLQDQPEDIQKKITPELTRLGYGKATPGAPAGGQTGTFGKRASDAELEKLYSFDRANAILDDTNEILGKKENQNMMGPFVGLNALANPTATDAKGLRDRLMMQQQQMKKFATDSALRGLTPETVDKLFPTILTNPKEAAVQMQSWRDLIAKEKAAYRQNLIDSGKILPETQQPAAAPSPTPTKTPSPQTAPKPSPAGPPAIAPPKAGDTIPGPGGKLYRFKGGDIHDKKNYQPI